MTSKVYDALKFFALVVLPGTGALYAAVAEVWGLPFAVQVVGTIAAVDTFLGIVLKKSSSNYGEQVKQQPVLGNLFLQTDVDGQPNGRFRLSANFTDHIFEDGKLVGFRVKRELERR